MALGFIFANITFVRQEKAISKFKKDKNHNLCHKVQNEKYNFGKICCK